ncbi:AAA family ATPase [Mycolicibacterium sp. 018/SC-01/001]|uniref:AAA family ATPase n=1 Tax=Mycolicibacterium sp. 018/SC-01/001 TaxID=2592069 RepID=UPI00117D3FAD|nr:LuxR family transcriptional regulator [Mycolicibacterium sp. 018/SC-01/001]TRW77839.1 AAA family ATPase [Mycolicibacterium sp. 018/SC-01/001]
MAAGVVSRDAENAALARFLDDASCEPTSLVIDGEPGIGKTTIWLTGVEQAHERDFQVLATRPTQTESVLAYVSLADLLSRVDAAVTDNLPAPQRLALDHVLLRGDTDAAPTDPRAVAAAFLSVIEDLTERGPVLIAIDDLQWLDRASADAVRFAARRLSGPVGLLAALRTGATPAVDLVSEPLPRPDSSRRITVGPLSLGALRTIIAQRLGESLPRPEMVRIHDISGGNPFYALQLAQSSVRGEKALQTTLSDLVRARVTDIGAPTADALLAVSCAGTPTLDLIADALHVTGERLSAILDEAEAKGLVHIEDRRIRFSHPLLAAGVYAHASGPRRRQMHAALAGIVTEPELRARHLARAVTVADEPTLHSLDTAAVSAGDRGAPATAAELLDMAIDLGGDTPERRIAAARHHLHAANFGEAATRLEQPVGSLPPGPLRAEALTLLALVRTAEEDFAEMAAVLPRVLADSAQDPARRAFALTLLSYAHLNLAQMAESAATIDEAVTLATGLDDDAVLSAALAFQAMQRFALGLGFDQTAMNRALELEDPGSATPPILRASFNNALLLAWTGQLDRGHEAMGAVRRRSLDRGEEHQLATLDFHSFLIALWRGDLVEAELLTEDALQRAQALGDAQPLAVGLTMRATVAAYAGQEQRARDDVAEAITQLYRLGAPSTLRYPLATLAFLEVSLGNYEAALQTLEPALALIGSAPMALEIMIGLFVPDAAEAMISVGRLDDAERLIDRLLDDGRRLDRAWPLACGARCRAMLLAARGDIDAATQAARRALTEHERLPMPFERARTQLLVGKLERRQRRNQAASEAFTDALRTFERLNTPLWAERTRLELGRANVGPHRSTALTPSEQRVAELAASGMTNRDIASSLFISPKTVEANLSRIYRKFGISSRAALARRMADDTDR